VICGNQALRGCTTHVPRSAFWRPLDWRLTAQEKATRLVLCMAVACIRKGRQYNRGETRYSHDCPQVVRFYGHGCRPLHPVKGGLSPKNGPLLYGRQTVTIGYRTGATRNGRWMQLIFIDKFCIAGAAEICSMFSKTQLFQRLWGTVPSKSQCGSQRSERLSRLTQHFAISFKTTGPPACHP
jgi:hypothetical protein